jgi:hypothetical protein
VAARRRELIFVIAQEQEIAIVEPEEQLAKLFQRRNNSARESHR